MSDVLSEIISFLKNEGVVSGEGTDTFIDFRPETPDQVISLFEYPGLGRLNGGVGAVRSVQISVRSPKHDPLWAKNKAWEIYNELCLPEKILDTRSSEYVTQESFWGVIEPRQTPFKILLDDNARTIYGFNIGLIVKED